MTKEPIVFKNKKYDSLSGYYFAPATDSSKEPIVFATGTGIRQSFYMDFCHWLCEEKKHPVLIFDFNGIGESLSVPIQESRATIRDWGLFDLPAAIDWLIKKTGSEKILLIGHSVGAQLAGIVKNYKKISKIVGISSSTGYVGNMPLPYKIKALLFFNAYIPLSNWYFGYTKTKAIKMGEDLPKEVAREWAQYCQTNGYIANAIGKTIFVNYFNNLTCPFTVIYSNDDYIARRANVEYLFKTYPSVQKKIVEINPVDYGLDHIGHSLFFKKKYSRLWPTIYQYIDKSVM